MVSRYWYHRFGAILSHVYSMRRAGQNRRTFRSRVRSISAKRFAADNNGRTARGVSNATDITHGVEAQHGRPVMDSSRRLWMPGSSSVSASTPCVAMEEPVDRPRTTLVKPQHCRARTATRQLQQPMLTVHVKRQKLCRLYQAVTQRSQPIVTHHIAWCHTRNMRCR